MVTIVEFLRARLDEDERAALFVDYQRDSYVAVPYDNPKAYKPHYSDPHATEHYHRHEPDRVQREIAAKRRIVDLADEATGLDVSVDLDRRTGHRDTDAEPYLGDLMIRALAAVYADHPDYREEWKP